LSSQYKHCPICDTRNHPQSVVCVTCGTSLSAVEISEGRDNTPLDNSTYKYEYGETDLLERSTGGKVTGYLVLFVTVVLAFGLGVSGILLLTNRDGNISNNDDLNVVDDAPTNEPLQIATVTVGPPTATASPSPLPTSTPTETPTTVPCIQQIVAGDSLIGAITRCGHTTLDIMPTVMALNGISDAAQIRSGQDIVIPWPTATFDPNITPTETATPNTDLSINDDILDDEFALVEVVDPFAPTATATLPAGVQWHTVQSEENLIVIAVAYNADAKVLSELNPEVNFSQCEFGERFGGPECTVQLSQGQQLRVPAPTPTPTLSPTPDPNATSTPTPTPTFNEPNAISPSDRTFFSLDDLITLRWVPTGTLGSDETYLIRVTDSTTGTAYSATTVDLFFLVPLEWQGIGDDRHEFEWDVSVITQGQPDTARFTTTPRIFFWQSRTGTSE